jgi:hypothetical protein
MVVILLLILLLELLALVVLLLVMARRKRGGAAPVELGHVGGRPSHGGMVGKLGGLEILGVGHWRATLALLNVTVRTARMLLVVRVVRVALHLLLMLLLLQLLLVVVLLCSGHLLHGFRRDTELRRKLRIEGRLGRVGARGFLPFLFHDDLLLLLVDLVPVLQDPRHQVINGGHTGSPASADSGVALGLGETHGEEGR